MAVRFARRIRPLLALAALASTVLLVPGTSSASPAATPPATPQPTIGEVQKQLDTLSAQNSQLVDKYNGAQILVTKRGKQAAAAEAAAAKAQVALGQAHQQFVQLVQAQFEQGTASTASALFTSQSKVDYFDQLDTAQLLSEHNANVVDLMTSAKKNAATASAQAKAALATATASRDALTKQKKQVQQQIDKYTTLLNSLTAAQKLAYETKSNPTVTKQQGETIIKSAPAPSAKAAIAVNYAMQQINKPYVWATAGPDTFDCSGLVMAAWAAAGVHIPHQSAEQYGYGTHVSRDQLQPGDLVFFYQPISHVGIYVGNGMMVDAVDPEVGVKMQPLSHSNSIYTGATRL